MIELSMGYAASLMLLAVSAGAASVSPGELRVELSGLRNGKGVLRLCLSANPRHFPNCGGDPDAKMINIPAARAGGLRFNGVAAGGYALSVMHDENGNGKLDTTMALPREGFGFSRNPVVRFGPPRFDAVRFDMPAGGESLTVRMKYFL